MTTRSLQFIILALGASLTEAEGSTKTRDALNVPSEQPTACTELGTPRACSGALPVGWTHNPPAQIVEQIDDMKFSRKWGSGPTSRRCSKSGCQAGGGKVGITQILPIKDANLVSLASLPAGGVIMARMDHLAKEDDKRYGVATAAIDYYLVVETAAGGAKWSVLTVSSDPTTGAPKVSRLQGIGGKFRQCEADRVTRTDAMANYGSCYAMHEALRPLKATPTPEQYRSAIAKARTSVAPAGVGPKSVAFTLDDIAWVSCIGGCCTAEGN